ncbi:unnamed protein product [Chondrus crispus]|uniref:Uncharacterized protein n=1 Tax=Chondrus crispus TaxID=2769 RepID=R7Q3U8_CHOCR|nr:unnamed protein product [Chondrus crispus]CDF32160.1 unnamed protein product [Chondrus crispus]|eukprot:XP_005711825.1 unnamed protein product [Chondrus crispus]
MVGAGSSSGSAAAGFYTAMPASETDGETFDGEADFDDYEEWDFAEMFSTASKNVKKYIFQPFVVGAAAAFGMSVGYAMFDATAAMFTRKGPSSKSR